MARHCVYEAPASNNIAREFLMGLEDDTRRLALMYESGVNGDLLPLYLRYDIESTNIDDVVNKITNGRIKSLAELSYDKEKALKYSNYLMSVFQNLFKASDDPKKLLRDAGSSSRIQAAYKLYKATQNGNLFAYKAVNGLLGMFGLNKSFELWCNRPNLVTHFEPAADVYYKLAQIDNFTKGPMRKIINHIHNMMRSVNDNPIFKQYGITQEIFNKTFGLIDGGYTSDINPTTLAAKLQEYDIILEPAGAIEVYNQYLEYRDKDWSLINYGYTKDYIQDQIDKFRKANPDSPLNDNQLLLEIASDDSILGSFRTLKSYYDELYSTSQNSMNRAGINPRHQEAIDAFNKMLEDFTARFDYVPGNHLQATYLEAFYADDSDVNRKLVYLPSFTRHRINNIMSDDGDFYHSATTMVTATGIMFEEASRILGYNKISDEMEKNYNWFLADSNRRAIQSGLMFYLHDLATIIDTEPENNNKALKMTRRISSALGLMPAMMLIGPNSAINNTIAGNYMLTMTTGTQHRMGRFEHDREQGNQLALAVDRYGSKMLGPGITREFEMFSPAGRNPDIIDQAHSVVQKMADKMGEGVIGLIPGGVDMSTTWRRLLSMKGSEDRLREHYLGLLYNYCLEDIGAGPEVYQRSKDIDELTQSQIKNLIERNARRAWYDTQQALGDFSPLAKPFWAHTLGDTTNNPMLCLAGAMFKMLYVFRHPMVTNVENFNTALARWGVSITTPELRKTLTPELKKAYKNTSAMVGLGVVFALYEFMRDAVFADRDSIQIGYTETFNPLQDFRNPINLLYASVVAPLFNLNISEEAYQRILANNVKFVMNMLGGNRFADVINADEGLSEVMPRIERIWDLPVYVFNTIFYPSTVQGMTGGKTNVLYAKRQEMRDQFGNLTKLDPVWWFERTLEAWRIKDPSNWNDVNKTFLKNTLGADFQTFLGLSVWKTNPQPIFWSTNSSYDREYAEERASRVFRKSSMGKAPAYLQQNARNLAIYGKRATNFTFYLPKKR